MSRRRSSSTATPATTTRSRSCSRSRRPSRAASASRPSPATRRSRRRPRTRSACSSSPAAPTSRSRRAPTGRSCASARRRVRPRRERARRARPAAADDARRSTQHAVDFLAERRSSRASTLVADRPADERRAAARAPPRRAAASGSCSMGGAIAEGNVTPAAEFNIWADPEAARARLRERDRPDDDRPRRHAPGALHAARTPSGCAAAGRVGRVVAELLDFFGAFHRQRYGFGRLADPRRGRGRARARPGLVETSNGARGRRRSAGELGRGRTYVDLLAPHRAEAERARRRRRSTRSAFLELLLERLAVARLIRSSPRTRAARSAARGRAGAHALVCRDAEAPDEPGTREQATEPSSGACVGTASPERRARTDSTSRTYPRGRGCDGTRARLARVAVLAREIDDDPSRSNRRRAAIDGRLDSPVSGARRRATTGAARSRGPARSPSSGRRAPDRGLAAALRPAAGRLRGPPGASSRVPRRRRARRRRLGPVSTCGRSRRRSPCRTRSRPRADRADARSRPRPPPDHDADGGVARRVVSDRGRRAGAAVRAPGGPSARRRRSRRPRGWLDPRRGRAGCA